MNKQIFAFLPVVLLFCIMQGCASGQQDPGTEDIKPGKIMHSIVCSSDSLVKYTLYLPTTYNTEKEWPVLICFDSHADGLLPVNLFRDEAEKNGFIIAGSNNSKNGMPTNETTALFRSILNDLQGRFKINAASVYTAGFSGGSRVAGAAAITEGNIAGVVGCGAGLPNLNQQPKSPFSYLAVAGTEDFNYTELRQLDKMLEKAGFVHHFLVFDGIHQWPPKQLVPDIFTWLVFDRMRRGSIIPDRDAIDLFIDQNTKKADDLGAHGDKPAEQQVFVKMRDYLQGLTDVSPLNSEISVLEADASVKTFKSAQAALFDKEQSLQTFYSPAVQQQSPEWWTRESSKLQMLSVKLPANDETRMYKRVLGYLSLNAYMLSSSAIKQNDLNAASRFIEIYSLVDPSNPEHQYMSAIVSARQGKTAEAIQDLDQAIKNGFKDFERLKTDPEFRSLQADKQYQDLIRGK